MSLARRLVEMTGRNLAKPAYRVSLVVDDKEDADALQAFFEKIQSLNNGGSTRTYGILDPCDAEEKAITVELDGDGHTRITDVTVEEIK